jgi:hypothetical protein
VFGAKVTRLRDGEAGERNGVGSARQLQIGPLPSFEETVTEFVVPQRIVYRITKGSPLRGHVGTMTFAATPGGTRFVYDIRIASPIPGLAPIVCASLTRSISHSLAGVERGARGTALVDIVAANEEAATVRKALDAEAAALAGVLARAFFDDPVFTWVLRGDMRRMKILRRGFELFLRRVWMAEEQTFTTGGAVGVAVWEPPGQWKHGTVEQLRLLRAMLAVFARHLPRVVRALTVLETGHPPEPAHAPHYYLAFLGLDLPWQGRGLGGALLAPVL